MSMKKKEVTLSGFLIRPIIVGKVAIYATEGHVYRTSRVTAIHEQTKDLVHFETKIAHYYLSMSPLPLAAVSAFPAQQAACA